MPGRGLNVYIEKGEVISVPHSHGIFYLTFKKLTVSLEKDCFDHVIFRRDLFLVLM